MKLNEIIELNGKEYTVELNRESLIKIEQYTNIQQASDKINKPIIEDKSNIELADDENPFADEISEDELEQKSQEKEAEVKKVFTRAFWIWLYPKEKLSLSQVSEILEPYFKDEESALKISELYKDLSQKSLDIREKYLEERKNLKALAK